MCKWLLQGAQIWNEKGGGAIFIYEKIGYTRFINFENSNIKDFLEN